MQGLLTALLGAFGHVVGGLVDTLNHVLLVFQLGEFGSDDAKDDVLVLGQELEWLEAARSRGV